MLAKRQETNRNDIAILRLEQLYPLRGEEILEKIGKYVNASITWVQDEPANYGPYAHLAINVFPHIGKPVQLISRHRAASPAAGSVWLHKIENETLIKEVFDL